MDYDCSTGVALLENNVNEVHLDYATTLSNRVKYSAQWTQLGKCDAEAARNGSALVNWLGAYKS